MSKTKPASATETQTASGPTVQPAAPATPAAPAKPATATSPAPAAKAVVKPSTQVTATPVAVKPVMKAKAPAPAKPVVKPVSKAVSPPAAKVAAKTAKQAPKAPVVATVKPAKAVKQKLVRDSFTFPESEYLTLVALKKRLLAAGTEVKKGELMRAGLALLSTLETAALAAAVGRIEKLKTGRPSK